MDIILQGPVPISAGATTLEPVDLPDPITGLAVSIDADDPDAARSFELMVLSLYPDADPDGAEVGDSLLMGGAGAGFTCPPTSIGTVQAQIQSSVDATFTLIVSVP